MKAKTQAKLFSVECGPRRRDGGGDSRRGGGDRPSRTPMPGDDTEEYEEEAKRLDRGASNVATLVISQYNST